MKIYRLCCPTHHCVSVRAKTKSNSALQFAILKHGLENLNYCIYEFFSYENKSSSFKLLTDLETMYIKKFEFNSLYKFMKKSTSPSPFRGESLAPKAWTSPLQGASLEGYIHTDVAKQKMVKRFENTINHPFSWIFSKKKC
jgi:hypothetical protein